MTVIFALALGSAASAKPQTGIYAGPMLTTAAAPNPKPAVVPTLREWKGGNGQLTLTSKFRITFPANQAKSSGVVAKTLQRDLKDATGLNATVGSRHSASQGTITLRIDPSIPSIGTEGFRLAIGKDVVITAHTAAGLFYGTRSLLQMALLSPSHHSVPKGTAVDWPRFHERGFMLDIGRKFFDMKYLRQCVKFMSWYKMNDLQLHLNDVGANNYAGFRLNSPKLPGLASKDGSFTRQEFESLEKLAAEYHVQITPEFDAPAHALAFTNYHPDLKGKGLGADTLDLRNPKTQPFIDQVWKTFIPWFTSPEVHIGADEYNGGDGSAPLFKKYIEDTAASVQAQGKKVRMWGSLNTVKNYDGIPRNIVMNIWSLGYQDPVKAVDAGFDIINTEDAYLYIVPFAGYYYQYLDSSWLYTSWKPNVFGKKVIPANSPQLLGGMFCVWNDKGNYPYTFEDVFDLIKPSTPVIGDVLWADHPADAPSYDQFTASLKKLGDGPGVHIAPPIVHHTPGDLAFGRPVKASSSETGDFGAETLVDGRAPTRWIASNKTPQWASIDLGQVQTVDRIIATWVPNCQASAWSVSVSTDGVNWTKVWTTTSGSGGREIAMFAPVPAKFVRIDCTKAGGGEGSYSLFSVEVH